MAALSPDVAKKFCEYCDWAQQCWLLRKHLYDDNPRLDVLNHPRNKHLFIQLEKILQEYWLNQVAKLHDRPEYGSRANLTIEYVMNATWESRARERLDALRNELTGLAQTIRVARNKLLSHNDLEVILAGSDLGAFEKGADTKYFKALLAFACVVHEEIIGSPYVFDDLVPNDIDALVQTLSSGLDVL